MPDFYTKLLDMIERLAPGMLLALGIGYAAGNRKTQVLESKLADAELQLKKAENNASVEEQNRGKSDLDILRASIHGTDKKP